MNNHIFRTITKLTSICLLGLFVVACGGGGGDRAGVLTYTATGKVTGDTLEGVKIELGGKAKASATTDTQGNYSFSGLSNGAYTLIPTKSNFSFSPSNTGFTINNANVTVAEFTASKNTAQLYNITGKVTGAITKDVLVTLNDKGNSTTYTNANGEYSFNNLISGTYKMTPALTGYVFNPASAEATITNANVTVVDFVSAAALASITISPAKTSITELGTQQYTATGVLSDNNPYLGTYTWISTCTPADAASISPSGLVTGNSQGSCSITASSGGKVSAPATLNVILGKLLGGTIQGTPLTLSTVVTTFAGTGVAGAVDGTGVAASFNNMQGIATDGSNLYVTDFYNHKIRKIVIATGVVTTLAGSGTAGAADGTGVAATFQFPRGITTDGSNLYVVDRGNYIIRKVVIATGEVSTMAGTGVAGAVDGIGKAASFNLPAEITADGSSLYVTDTDNNTIRKIVIASGVVTTVAGSASIRGSADGTGTTALFSHPYGITTDGNNLYVADWGNHTIRKIVIATGVVTTIAGTGVAGAVDNTGTAASFNGPGEITTDGSNLYVADAFNHKIRKIVIASGVVTTVAGSGVAGVVDSTGTAASFNTPGGITTDGKNLYLADILNHKIRKIE